MMNRVTHELITSYHSFIHSGNDYTIHIHRHAEREKK